MKSKELKIYNLPINFKPHITIDAKPHLFLALVFVVGIVLCLNEKTMVYGVAVAVVGISFLMFLPKLIMLEFYDDYMILHNKANKSDCVLIYYEDVVSWNYQWNAKKDYLFIELEDGSVEKIEAFSKTEFELAMNRYLKDKRKKTK